MTQNHKYYFQLFPTEEQRELIEKTFRSCAIVYNKALAFRQMAYKQMAYKQMAYKQKAHNDGTPVGFKQTRQMLTQLKKQEEYAYLNEVDSQALIQELWSLDIAYKMFFQHLADYPKPKNINISEEASYKTISNNNSIKIVDEMIRLPKIGYVKFGYSEIEGVEIEGVEIGKIRSVIVHKTFGNEYLISIITD